MFDLPTEARHRIGVDESACIGAGQCVLAAPEVFDQDDDGIVIVLGPKPTAELLPSVREAALLCPAAVIRLIENE